jgi:hypothetical protein
MAEVLAVASFAYPIVKDLSKLVIKLNRLLEQIRNAEKDLSSVIKRTI